MFRGLQETERERGGKWEMGNGKIPHPQLLAELSEWPVDGVARKTTRLRLAVVRLPANCSDDVAFYFRKCISEH